MSESKDIASVAGVIWELLAFRSPSTPARNDVVDRAISLLSALEKDAGRYRWLRDARYDYDDWYVTGRDAQGSVTTPLMEAELDTAIDLARGAT